MKLQLAENGIIGYTFVPYDENIPNVGAYVRNDILKKVLDEQKNLNGFFGSVWKGIKDVANFTYKNITGSGQTQQPVIIQQPPAPPAPQINPTYLLAGFGILALLLLKKK